MFFLINPSFFMTENKSLPKSPCFKLRFPHFPVVENGRRPSIAIAKFDEYNMELKKTASQVGISSSNAVTSASLPKRKSTFCPYARACAFPLLKFLVSLPSQNLITG